MKRIGLDLGQSSSIILTTVTDVLGFIAFLGFAVLFQKFLLSSIRFARIFLCIALFLIYAARAYEARKLAILIVNLQRRTNAKTA